MFALGLTGGIGCGKSAVADLLEQRGAHLIDADRVAREVVEPGQPTHRALVERFGNEILHDDGRIDRAALASLTFADPSLLADLNALTHPAIGLEILRQLAELRNSGNSGNSGDGGDGGVIVLAIPLLRAEHRATMQLDAVVVVDCPFPEALRRLVELRGMDRADAEARIAAQPAREERIAEADHVVDNAGTPDELPGEVDRLWDWIEACRAGSDPNAESDPDSPTPDL